MKLFIVGIIAALGLSLGVSEVEWKTDIEEAKKEAAESGKYILLNFSGSDWCSNCIKLEKVLFESQEFKEFASKNYVLLNADFPSRKANKLSKEQTTHNEALAEKYNKSGKFPAVFILSPNGDLLGKMGHPFDTAQEYIDNLNRNTPQ